MIYDAKVRRGGFIMGTEDRKFREYIEREVDSRQKITSALVYPAIIACMSVERTRIAAGSATSLPTR